MKRNFLYVVLGLLIVVALAPGALAAPPNDGCGVGPGEAGNSTIGAWELWDQATLATNLVELQGFDEDVAEVVAEEEFEAWDRNVENGDGLMCFMIQRLPNDATGQDTWFIFVDNTAKKKGGQ